MRKKRTCLSDNSYSNCYLRTALLLCFLFCVNTAPSSSSSSPSSSSSSSISSENIGIEDHILDELHPSQSVYTNQFVIRSSASPDIVKQISHEHGFDYVISVSIFSPPITVKCFI